MMAHAGEHAPLIPRQHVARISKSGTSSRPRCVLGVVLAALIIGLVASTPSFHDAISRLRGDLFGGGAPPTVRVLVNPTDWPERDRLDVVTDTWRRYHEESGAVVVPLELPDLDRWPMGGGYSELTARTADLLPGTKLDFLAFDPDDEDVPLAVTRGRQRVASSSLGHLSAWLDARREDPKSMPALLVVDADDPGDPKLQPLAMTKHVAHELVHGANGWDVLYLDRGTARYRWKFYVVSARFLTRLPELLRTNQYVTTAEWTKGLCRAGTLRCFDYFGEVGGVYPVGEPPPPPPAKGEGDVRGKDILNSGGDWHSSDNAVASIGQLEDTAVDVDFSSNDRSYKRAHKVEKAIGYHTKDLPRNSSRAEDLAMTLARGLSPALDEIAEVASKTADEVVDFILNGVVPEEDDWVSKNKERMEEELRDQEDAREREVAESEAAMERKAMEDLWSDGPEMDDAIREEQRREEDETETAEHEKKVQSSQWLADVLG